MKKWTLKIINNESGKVEGEVNTDAIIGGAETDDGSVTIFLTSCDSEEYAAALYSAKKAVYQADKHSNNLIKVILEKMISEESFEIEEGV